MDPVFTHLNDPRHWAVPEILHEQATTRPDQLFLRVLAEGELTYAEAHDQAGRMASHLADAGVGPGDVVCAVLPNGLDFVRVWLGLNRLGAVMAPLNTALEGDFLAHQLRDSGAGHVVTTGPVTAAVERVLPDLPSVRRLELDGWQHQAPFDGSVPQGRDLACIMYTSGTTGLSKGVLMPHAHCALFGVGTIEGLGLTADDTYYISMPLFHANGLFMQLMATLIAGGSAVLRGRFSASSWLADIRQHGCTVTNMLGAMTQFVIAQPPSPLDRDHRLRVVCPVPNPPAHEEVLRHRFGIPDVVSAYGMTEVNIPLYGRLGHSRPGTAGLVLDRWFEVTVRDPETDEEAPRGQLGEIMVRPKVPFGFTMGYVGRPEATVDSLRNFWFHTGDSGTMDGDGWVTFVDRTKDCIRRRGENISSFEVEEAVRRLDGVAEVAAYAVPADVEGTEDEVMLAVVPAEGSTLAPEAVAEHADRVLPRFARPRYVDVLDELPKTPTEKVRKQQLRARGVTVTTWVRDEEPARPAPVADAR
jgi:carnitine-CoA ligase